MNMKFRIKDEDQGVELQEVLFSQGYIWGGYNTQVINKGTRFIYVYAEDKMLALNASPSYFEDHSNEEMDTATYITQHKPPVTTPHIHASLIKAWADGAEIEVFLHGCIDKHWYLDKSPVWSVNGKYRIKPARVFPVTSISEEDIYRMLYEGDNSETFRAAMVRIANATIKQHILDCENI